MKIASKPSSKVLRLPELPIMQKSETQNLWMQSMCTFLCLDSTYSPSHKNASKGGLRCAIFWCPGAAGAVGGGKQENTWRTGAHSLPQLCTLNTSGGEDHKRFLQIEAVRAGVLVAADVWLACTHNHLPHTQPPAECSQPKCHKMQKNKDVKILVHNSPIHTNVCTGKFSRIFKKSGKWKNKLLPRYLASFTSISSPERRVKATLCHLGLLEKKRDHFSYRTFHKRF